MAPGSSSALKASRGGTAQVRPSTTQRALSGETLARPGTHPSVPEPRASVPCRDNGKDGRVDNRPTKETLQAPIKPQPSKRASATQISMDSELPPAPKQASPDISSSSSAASSSASRTGHAQPQQPSQDEADNLTTFPPFAVSPKDKVKQFLESQGLGEPSDAPHRSALDHLRSRPPTPWPGAGADPESVPSMDDARPPVPSPQLPRVPTADEQPPLHKPTADKRPKAIDLKDLRLSQLDISSRALSSLPASSRFHNEDDISIIDEPGRLTPITEVPSELSRANSPIDSLLAGGKPRPIIEQPNPPVKKPLAPKPVEMPTPRHVAPAAREVPKPQPPPSSSSSSSSSTVLSSMPDRPGTPQVPVGLSKPKPKAPAGGPHVRPDVASTKKLERKPSKLKITTTSNSAVDSGSRRQSETTSETRSDKPATDLPQQRLSSPFNPLKSSKQAWDLETIASEDSWFQENEDGEDGEDSDSGESGGPRRTPPGPVRARLTVETVECTFRPPAQTPDLDQAQYDTATGQARNEFFPPWAVGSQALSEGARDLRT
ncbi:hypothetical protein BDV26DRAFT_303517 [Aspergillus bertholletiae]|uniref:Uncharacterized protein n=1 Tax=Aspergillus bertholletiae TaxID=1226010 RepID=A0A5N7BNX2_9EURO|nr:hypothetical protein BDV26DRAFT_303517 [Aspergillus bertholletiae]